MTSIYSSSPNHWSNYQLQIDKYLLSIKNNPFKQELESDFKNEKIQRIAKNFTIDYKKWFVDLINNSVINEKWLNMINYKYNDCLKLFCKYVEHYLKYNAEKLVDAIDNEDIIKYVNDNKKKVEFSPSALKFVTTTGIAYLDCKYDDDKKMVNFNKFYEHFIPPENVVKNKINKSDILYNESVVNKIIGCKTGDKPIKGYFKKNGKDFYNCATLNVVLTNTKSANVKMFANGKLQLTGIPSPELGEVTLKIICDLIRKMNTNEITKDKKTINMKSYKTVMINTCYELGFQINREVLYTIMLNRYKIQTIYESDGYPGVRVQYYYNTSTTNTINEGQCICGENKCDGKGNGNGYILYKITENDHPNDEITLDHPSKPKLKVIFRLPNKLVVGQEIEVPILNNCRKISIAIFQSGSVIIAGGCNSIGPINIAYNFINNIIRIIYNEIKKNETTLKKTINKKKKIVYLDKSKITNLNLYIKLMQSSNKKGIISSKCNGCPVNKLDHEININKKKKKIKIKKK